MADGEKLLEDEKITQWIKKNIEGAGNEPIVFDRKFLEEKVSKPLPEGRIHPKGRGVLRVIPLGGLDEVGKNMMVLEFGRDIIIIDMGFQFPEEDMLGVDYVIPDITYLANKLDRIRGVIITHGHLDHIGAIPYLLPKLGNPPFFGTRLTLGLVQKRLEEFGLERKARLHVIDPAKTLRLGSFWIEFFRVNHSIPDSVGVILRTPAGTIVHTGDFKFDFTPVFQKPADYSKIASLRGQNVMALFSDSTNALRPGATMSEQKIGENLQELIVGKRGRIIIAAFASLIGRLQQIILSAAKVGRKVYVSGRSMIDNIAIAQKLGYLKYPPGLIQPIKKLGNSKDDHVLVITTGAQGEAVSALTRMSLDDHAHISIKKGDTVVISSSPIPGNERAIFTVINNLCRLGAKVIFNQVMDVHTSGHAQQEDLKLMIQLVNPKFLVPIHGELFMRQAHAELGQSLGMNERNTILLENGDVLEIGNGEAKKAREKVSANYVMIDGKGIGDVGAQIIMDRQILAENGCLVVLFTIDAKSKRLLRDPEVISRGFIYMKESEEIIREISSLSKKTYQDVLVRYPRAKRGEVKSFIRGAVDRFAHKKLERRPLIFPILVEF